MIEEPKTPKAGEVKANSYDEDIVKQLQKELEANTNYIKLLEEKYKGIESKLKILVEKKVQKSKPKANMGFIQDRLLDSKDMSMFDNQPDANQVLAKEIMQEGLQQDESLFDNMNICSDEISFADLDQKESQPTDGMAFDLKKIIQQEIKPAVKLEQKPTINFVKAKPTNNFQNIHTSAWKTMQKDHRDLNKAMKAYRKVKKAIPFKSDSEIEAFFEVPENSEHLFYYMKNEFGGRRIMKGINKVLHKGYRGTRYWDENQVTMGQPIIPTVFRHLIEELIMDSEELSTDPNYWTFKLRRNFVQSRYWFKDVIQSDQMKKKV